MELEEVIGLGASAAGIFRLVPAQATNADSAIYAVIDVDRDTAGAYRIDESIAGSRSTTSGGCGGFSTGNLSDLGFGAYLAMVTTQIVRCAETARARIKKQ